MFKDIDSEARELPIVTDYTAYCYLVGYFHDRQLLTYRLIYKLGKEEDLEKRKELFTEECYAYIQEVNKYCKKYYLSLESSTKVYPWRNHHRSSRLGT